MPFGLKPKCNMCKTTTSSMWRKTDEDEVICNSCSVRSCSVGSSKNNNGNSCPFTLRKSTRAKSSKCKQQVISKTNNPKDVKGGIYYAQLRGLLQDQYCEKSAVITWLLPTHLSPKGRFDPATYILGPEEEIPRKLECFEFVCHAPSEYYMAKNTPYPIIPERPDCGYVWTRIGPRIVPLPSQEEVFGTS
ncbi:GATA zinc finger domain-containing protein 1 [Trichonephila clavata]|uniref:GATA zinc finger domain-containing protein 1 n=1 Tax=Trichonephila clavata TaxID=2740835 RepID=A0A8X6FQL5_TRICU|nr:GATA zinc finger domain-containing protein 1 [Trichonephila clavata]